MSLKKHLKMTKEMVDVYGWSNISASLGYKTSNTVRSWFYKNNVPKVARVYVENLHDMKMRKENIDKFLRERLR